MVRVLVAVLVPLLGASAARAQAEPASGPDSSVAWQQFLTADTIFGDYSDVPADDAALQRARALVYQTVSNGSKKGSQQPEKRRAARALWVGVNLEYQGMLTAAAPAQRQDYAWRCLALAGMLRTLLDTVPLADLEGEAQSRAQWRQALLRLDAIQAEAGGEVPFSAPSLRQQVREAVAREFAPFSPDGGPNQLLMVEVGKSFKEARELATTAAAATVQASLALGKVYGYPPEEKRKKAQPRLPAAEVVGDAGVKGLYPSGEADGPTWKAVVDLVKRTDGGGTTDGLVNDYAAAREALGVAKDEEVLRALAQPPSYGKPPPLFAPYQLAALCERTGKVAERVVAIAPKSADPPGFGSFTIDAGGTPSEGGLQRYVRWFEEQGVRRSQAALELERLRSQMKELRTRQEKAEPLPLDDTAVKNLVRVASYVMGWDEATATTHVRTWLTEWVNQERIKLVPRQDVFRRDAPAPGGAAPQQESPVRRGASAPARSSLRGPSAAADDRPPERRELSAAPLAVVALLGSGLDEKPASADKKEALDDQSFLLRCVAGLRQDLPLPLEGPAAPDGAATLSRLKKLRDGNDPRLKPVAEALWREHRRLEALRPQPKRIDDEIAKRSRQLRDGQKSRVDTLLEDGEAADRSDSFVARQKWLAGQQKEVASAAVTIANSFATWGTLADSLAMHRRDAVAILQSNGRKDILTTRLADLGSRLDHLPTYDLDDNDRKALRAYLFPVQGDGDGHLPVPFPAENDAPGRIRFVRQAMEAARMLGQEVPGRIRKGSYEVADLPGWIRKFRQRYGSDPVDVPFDEALTQLNPRPAATTSEPKPK
jgi:hypothetical protein